MSDPKLDPEQLEVENPYDFPLVPRFYLQRYSHLARPPGMPWDTDARWYDTFLAYMTEKDHFMVNILLDKHNDERKAAGLAVEPKKYFLSKVIAAGCHALFEQRNLDLEAMLTEEKKRLESYCQVNSGAVEEFRKEKRKRNL